jgi:hypothetical protein
MPVNLDMNILISDYMQLPILASFGFMERFEMCVLGNISNDYIASIMGDLLVSALLLCPCE